jgi:hypothetical protein
MERNKPLAEDRADCLIALEVDASDLACAVVEVEVTGEFLVFRLLHQTPNRLANFYVQGISTAVASGWLFRRPAA